MHIQHEILLSGRERESALNFSDPLFSRSIRLALKIHSEHLNIVKTVLKQFSSLQLTPNVTKPPHYYFTPKKLFFYKRTYV